MESLLGGIGWSEEAGFFEELRVQVVVYAGETEEESERVLRVPCCRKPEGGESWGSKEDSAGLEGILRAHAEAVAG